MYVMEKLLNLLDNPKKVTGIVLVGILLSIAFIVLGVNANGKANNIYALIAEAHNEKTSNIAITEAQIKEIPSRYTQLMDTAQQIKEAQETMVRIALVDNKFNIAAHKNAEYLEAKKVLEDFGIGEENAKEWVLTNQWKMDILKNTSVRHNAMQIVYVYHTKEGKLAQIVSMNYKPSENKVDTVRIYQSETGINVTNKQLTPK